MKNYIKEAENLRAALHAIPEFSMQETRTKALLMEYLKKETDLQIVDCGKWFYAVCYAGHVSAAGEADVRETEAIAYRADFDAVAGMDGKPGHFCGHDGHSAVLSAFGKWLSDNRDQLERDVYLIFQPGEETGEGAKLCAPFLKEQGISEIYGFHNIPGQPVGSIVLPGFAEKLNTENPDTENRNTEYWTIDNQNTEIQQEKRVTFACASTGLEIAMKGTPSHAAYPEAGKNPAFAIASVIQEIPRLLAKPHRGMILATVIGTEIGSASYGVSASEGVLRLTVRGAVEEEFEALVQDISNCAKQSSARDGLTCTIKEIERFPATENDVRCMKKVRDAANQAEIACVYPQEPFRWSEDFGYYLREVPGTFFGIGAGENHPQLHTKEYEFPDEIIGAALNMFAGIL